MEAKRETGRGEGDNNRKKIEKRAMFEGHSYLLHKLSCSNSKCYSTSVISSCPFFSLVNTVLHRVHERSYINSSFFFNKKSFTGAVVDS